MSLLLIKNARIVNEGKIIDGDVLIDGEFIVDIDIQLAQNRQIPLLLTLKENI